MSTTAFRGYTKPTVGGDTDAWGGELNTNLDSIDTDMNSALTGVAASLPLAGGTMSGTLNAKAETHAHVPVTPAAGVATCDLSLGNSFAFTVAAATAITFTNVPASGKLVPIFLEITNGGAFATTFTVPPKTPGAGGVPTLTTSGKDFLALVTRDGGTTYSFMGSTRDVR